MIPNYNGFIQNETIQRLSTKEKWTISTKDKMPIDMWSFLHERKISGALFKDARSLVSLTELHKHVPNAANYAFYLDAYFDNVCVLDIEPKCPAELKEQLLSMQGALYVETSMSGKGIHMVFPLPADILRKYPNASQKIVLKENHGYYEVLLNHYVTFTTRSIDNTNMSASINFEDIFEELCKNQKAPIEAHAIDFSEMKPVDAKMIDKVFELLRTASASFRKTPADYNDDMSKFEFAYVAYMYGKLRNILAVSVIQADHNYTTDEKVWILHTIVSDTLPHRAKHDELRNSLPWLVYLITQVMAKSDTKK